MKKHALLSLSLIVVFCFAFLGSEAMPENDKQVQVKITKVERNGKEVIVHFQLKNTGDPIDLALKNNDGSYALGKNGRKYKLKKLVIGNQKSSRLVGKRSQKLDKNKSINGMAIFDVPDETNDFKEIKISSKNKFSAKFKNVKTKDKKPSPSKRFKPSSKKLEKPRK